MKYIIDIENVPMTSCTKNNYCLWKAKKFDTLVFNEYDLNKLEPYCPEADRNKVEDEVWSFIRYILLSENNGGMPACHFKKVFGDNLEDFEKLLKENSYKEFLRKYLEKVNMISHNEN